jgi:hypothetical protein
MKRLKSVKETKASVAKDEYSIKTFMSQDAYHKAMYNKDMHPIKTHVSHNRNSRHQSIPKRSIFKIINIFKKD